MSRRRKGSSRTAAFLLLIVVCFCAAGAPAATNQFRGVNWADPGDNFQAGVLYVSGLSSSDTYNSALAVGNAIMGQFVSKLGANSVRLPINEPTVSQYWSTYTGAIDAVLSKGKVVLCYWDRGKSNKPPDMNAFWNMWKTVVDKYGSNDNAYFEIFNEPNMYSKTDLASLYSSWLTQFSTVPKSRVILDGTGDAQNVSDVGSASALDGCLLAVHDYSFFGSDSMTSESDWANHIKDEVGNYADRTVCTEWGGPMSPGSKNGVSYDYLDYSKSPTNYFEGYIRGISSQLRSWNMGSFYWPGLRDGDWYSMTIKSGSGSNITLSIPNQSGLDRLQYAWGYTPGSGGTDGGVGGSAGSGGAGGSTGSGGAGGSTGSGRAGADGGVGGSAGGGSGRGGADGGPGGGSAISSGGAAGNTAGSTGSSGVGGADGGRGGSAGATAVAGGASGGASASVGATGGSGGTVATGGTAEGSGGTTVAVGGSAGNAGGSSPSSSGGNAGASGAASSNASHGGSDSGGATHSSTVGSGAASGCSCTTGRSSRGSSAGLVLLLGLVAISAKRRRSTRG